MPPSLARSGMIERGRYIKIRVHNLIIRYPLLWALL